LLGSKVQHHEQLLVVGIQGRLEEEEQPLKNQLVEQVVLDQDIKKVEELQRPKVEKQRGNRWQHFSI
jgi:hypothetical protein